VVISEAEVRAALDAVMDPEIPTCSITDLGIVQDVRVDKATLEIDLLPTFAGCPALDAIKKDVEKAATDLDPTKTVTVRFVNAPPWTTDRLSDDGKRALNDYGISSPVLLQIGQKPACPFCGSTDTAEESAFGPTPCRSIRYCNSCRNPFEGFKTKLPPTASAS
jgi:ring-1,2-phenylacetyl-CoA epoxidase subunit PaaD